MKSYKKIILPLICLIAFLISALCGCVCTGDDIDFEFDNKYNAQITSTGGSSEIGYHHLFTNKFWNDSRTLGCKYKNEDYSPTIPGSEKYIVDTTSPTSRTYLINNQELYNETFSEGDTHDFDKNMFVVYVGRGFTDGTIMLKSTEVKDRNLIIEYVRIEKKECHSIFTSANKKIGGTAPIRIWIVVKMDKLDVDTAEFI